MSINSLILRLFCELSGHEYMRRFQRTPNKRLYLECQVCGQQTDGWPALGTVPPREVA